MSIGDEIIAGDTIDFTDQVDAYPPADGWTLKYQLIPRFATPAQTPITLTGTTYQTTLYRVQEAAAVTAAWKPGAYTWARWVEKAGPIRQSLGEGQLAILQDPASAAQGYDARTHARRMLDQIETALEALNFGAKSYTIGSRSYTSFDKAELITMHDRYLRLVADEDAAAAVAAGNSNPRKVGVRFDDVR